MLATHMIQSSSKLVPLCNWLAYNTLTVGVEVQIFQELLSKLLTISKLGW